MSKEHLKPPRSTHEAKERGKNGGIASGEARRKKKTIREIVEAYLDGKIKGNEEMVKLAKKAGLTENATIKELVSAACLLNTMIKGDIEDLAKVAELLGEAGNANAEKSALDALCDALKAGTQDA